ncbi:MAG: RNase adapter RapZ [Mycoplasmatales bacterium]
MKNVLTIIGVSGSGRSTVMQTLNDEKYVILENFNTKTLQSTLSILLNDNKTEKIAVLINVKDKRRFTKRYNTVTKLLESTKDIQSKTILLTTTHDVLINRFQETRKKHPLLRDYPELSLEEAITQELSNIDTYEQVADFIIDTSNLSPKDLKSIMENYLSLEQGNLQINLQSFGFKYGMPKDSDMVFDVRFLPNPFYVEDLKEKTGLDQEVSRYVFSFEQSEIYYIKLLDFIKLSIDNYKDEGRMLITISIGCTGGKHRSVSFVQRLAQDLEHDNIVINHVENKKGRW